VGVKVCHSFYEKFYRCAKCEGILREGYKLKVYENRVIRRIFGPQGIGINRRIEKIT
jgi:hypothetical protein